MVPRPVEPDAARSLVTDFEQSLSGDARRADGVHYTPSVVSGPVLELALAALGRVPRTVCDPTCGGGAFLLTVADRLLADGVPAAEIVRDRLIGMELDVEAVRVREVHAEPVGERPRGPRRTGRGPRAPGRCPVE